MRLLAGDVPGIGDIRDLFTDDIHPNGKGQYLIAMVHVATITGQSPEGLPTKLLRVWQSRESVITDDQAKAFQRIAWQATEAQLAREAVAATLVMDAQRRPCRSP